MKIDLQIHSVYSSQALYKKDFLYYQNLLDSTMEIEKIFEVAKKVGLGAISITDHGETYAIEYIEREKINNILSIRGVEAKTNLGEILIYGDVKKINLKEFDYFKIVKQAKNSGCLVVIPHPFLENPFGYNGLFCKTNLKNKEILEEALTYADAMDVYYIRTGVENKLKELAGKYDLVSVATSDAHYYSQIGEVYTEIPNASSEEEILEHIRNGRIMSLVGKPTMFDLKTIISAIKGQTLDRFKTYNEFENI